MGSDTALDMASKPLRNHNESINYMNIFKKAAGGLVIVALLAIVLIPRSSFASNYIVSPSFVGTSTMSTSTANQVCASLPDAVAAQQSFCSYSAASSSIGIADQSILISVRSSSSAHITWNTSTPTTTALWYNMSALNTNSMSGVQYVNLNEGYTTSHSIDLSGIDLTQVHLFQVGGVVQGSTSQITSGQQLI